MLQAETAYRQIIDTVPNHAGGIHNLGLILYQRGNIEEAIAMYRRALEIAPNYDEAYNNLGVALEKQGRLNEAYNAYQQALQLNPAYATAYNNRASVARRADRLFPPREHPLDILRRCPSSGGLLRSGALVATPHDMRSLLPPRAPVGTELCPRCPTQPHGEALIVTPHDMPFRPPAYALAYAKHRLSMQGNLPMASIDNENRNLGGRPTPSLS